MSSEDKSMMGRDISFQNGNRFGGIKGHRSSRPRPVCALYLFSNVESHNDHTSLISRAVGSKLRKYMHSIEVGSVSRARVTKLASVNGINIPTKMKRSEYVVLALRAYEKKAMHRLHSLFSENALLGYLGYTYRKTNADLRELESDFSSGFKSFTKKVGFLSSHNESRSFRVLMRAVMGEYIYAMAGLVAGLGAIIAGVMLLYRGVSGSSSWVAEVLGLSSEISDAPPGVILFVVGLFIIWVSKPKVVLERLRG